MLGLRTRHGAGCSSGDGVCGLPCLSPPSLVATGAFMPTGLALARPRKHKLLGAPMRLPGSRHMGTRPVVRFTKGITK